ncbi:MAG: LCP family protein [Agathobacter sp.]|nr:LCP family protein [Agathobacter sp.]
MPSRKSKAEGTAALKKKKRITKRQKQKRKLIIFGVEVLCLLLLLGVLYVWSLFSKVTVDRDFSSSEAGINEDLGDDTLITLQGYTNIALFGLDNRTEGQYDQGLSDVIMIASINNQTKEVKLLSVYRDTYLNIGKGKYNKANSAYLKGGAKQAVQMLNTNLDLNIKEYACVDWMAVTEAVDALGGVTIDVTKQEVPLINAGVREMNSKLKTNSPFLEAGGKVRLNGVQATSYARIRYTAGNDFKRSSRQRIVLEAMLTEAKKADIGTLLKICNSCFDDISTSLSLDEIIGLVKHVKEYKIAATTGFPFTMTTKQLSGSGDTVVPIDMNGNVSKLHEFLFDVEDYQPSKTVQVIHDAIIQKTGVTENSSSIDVEDFNNTAGQTGTVFEKEEDTETEE